MGNSQAVPGMEGIADDTTAVICAYGRPQETIRALASITRQTLTPKEIIVVDDASDPPLVLPQHPRLRVIRHPENKGAGAARNTGVWHAATPFVAFLDTDDIWHPEKLARQMPHIRSLDAAVAGSFTAYCRPRSDTRLRNGIISTPSDVSDWWMFFAEGLRAGPGSTLIIRREAFLDVGGFDETFRRLEDWDLLLRLATKYQFSAVPDVLTEVTFSGRPDPVKVERALRLMEAKHLAGGRLSPPQRRRLRAGIAFERGALARYRGNRLALLRHVGETLQAPGVLMKEIKFSLHSRHAPTADHDGPLVPPISDLDMRTLSAFDA